MLLVEALLQCQLLHRRIFLFSSDDCIAHAYEHGHCSTARDYDFDCCCCPVSHIHPSCPYLSFHHTNARTSDDL